MKFQYEGREVSSAELSKYKESQDAFTRKKAKRFPVPEYWEMPNDLSEIPSKAMEQLSYEYTPLFFGERAPQFVKPHLITILEEINIRLQYEADKDKGLAIYKKLCGLGGSLEYDGTMEALGLPLPYSEQAVMDIKDYLAEKILF